MNNTISTPPLTPSDIASIYRAILSHSPNDPKKARRGLEAYLAGHNGTLPLTNPGAKVNQNMNQNMNQTKLDQFMAAYVPALTKAVNEHPEEYAWHISKLPSVVNRTRAALERNQYMPNGRAMRETCKVLGFKNTRVEINAFLANEAKYKIGDQRRLTVTQFDTDNYGHERETPPGSLVAVLDVLTANAENPYILGCLKTGAWWFFSEADLDTQTVAA
jgi:hypothetical protein